MTNAKVNRSVTELPLEIAHERTNPDAFDGLFVAMQGIELDAALGIPEILPVGGLVAGAGKARFSKKVSSKTGR